MNEYEFLGFVTEVVRQFTGLFDSGLEGTQHQRSSEAGGATLWWEKKQK